MKLPVIVPILAVFAPNIIAPPSVPAILPIKSPAIE